MNSPGNMSSWNWHWASVCIEYVHKPTILCLISKGLWELGPENMEVRKLILRYIPPSIIWLRYTYRAWIGQLEGSFFSYFSCMYLKSLCVQTSNITSSYFGITLGPFTLHEDTWWKFPWLALIKCTWYLSSTNLWVDLLQGLRPLVWSMDQCVLYNTNLRRSPDMWNWLCTTMVKYMTIKLIVTLLIGGGDTLKNAWWCLYMA